MIDQPDSARERILAARTAVMVVFAIAGVTFASWASRIPDAKHALNLGPGELGLTLFALSAGSLVAMPSTGRIATRIGIAATIRIGLSGTGLGLFAVAAGVDIAQSRYAVMAGLFLIGLGVGIWDVAMNLEGAAVERLLGQTVMPHFHAAFSAGTVVSALLGALMARFQVPLLVHLGGAAALVVIGTQWALRGFLPRGMGEEAPSPEVAEGPSRSAWTEPRTLLIGAVTLVAAFTEGTANDWLAVALVEGYGLPTWAGVLGFAVFLSFMTLGRLLGTRWLDQFGRVLVLRVTFALAILGSLLVIFGGPVLAFVGSAVWGVGVSLGFPVGMSASADEPARAHARMSTVATIGYLAFIAGPPILGLLGEHVGVLQSLLAVGTMAAITMLAIPAVREPDRAPDGRAL